MGLTNTLMTRYMVFGVSVLKLVDQLPKTRTGRHVADQLLRSGTSAGANYHEARGAESPADFVHKLQVALKEIREAGYWIGIIGAANLLDSAALSAVDQECNELTAILAKSVQTAKRNIAQNNV